MHNRIIQIVFPALVPWGTINGRALSTIGNPLHLSAFIAMIMPLTLAMAILKWKGAKMRNTDKVAFRRPDFTVRVAVCVSDNGPVFGYYPGFCSWFIHFFGLLGLYLKRNSL